MDDAKIDVRYIGRFIRKYQTDLAHVRHVAALSGKLFRELISVHKLDASCSELLEVSALMHDVGHFISERKHHEHGEYLILNDPLLDGMEEGARRTAACLARNHRKRGDAGLEQWTDSTQLNAVRSLIAILRIADVLDYEHRQEANIRAEVVMRGEERTIALTTKGMDLQRYEKKIRKKSQPAADHWQHVLLFQSEGCVFRIEPNKETAG
ncbi:HD domain-containing protein [Paenibacillus turpanensis]|uniref:HD domain-containing protein n=1 Tax=Paenibacillus turpanensis TaxID=2689078 RepID=UPI001407555F|nr:HD domain-containing protein [Paenibacillus turpanensis]